MAPLPLHATVPPGLHRAPRILVALHGFTQAGGAWAPLHPALARHGAVLAPDLVGHGRSPAPTDVTAYAMDACLDQLEALLDRLGVGRAWWVGYSMGGRVALQMAVHRPHRVRGLVLISATPGLADPTEAQTRRDADEALATRIERDGVAAFVDFWEGLPLFTGLKQLPSATQAAIRATRLRNSATGLANSLRGMGTGSMPPVWDALPAVRVPTLLITGADDAKFTALGAQMAAAMPHARHVVLPGVGHACHLEAPGRVAQAIDGLLQGEALR